MCQNEVSKSRTLEQSECSPLLASFTDDSYHSFPSPKDQSIWTRRLSKLRIRNEGGHDDADDRCAPWAVILFGQSIAVALAVGNFSFSTLENQYRMRTPALTMGVVYLVLSFHLVYLFAKQHFRQQTCEQRNVDIENSLQDCTIPDDIDGRSNGEEVYFFPFTNFILQTPWQIYLLLAVLDVEANYLTMISFRHTSLSSSMLLTSLSVFSTLLFRRCIFGETSTSYSYKKIVGVFISVIGACLWIRKDFNQSNHAMISSPGHYVMYGDMLAFASASLYGLNDVLLEYTVKANNDRIEYLGMIGLFGFLFSIFIQAPLFEKQELREIQQQFYGCICADIMCFHIDNELFLHLCDCVSVS
jgi:solute carrier family 35 protein F1/2